jgi:hypothetical protein
MMLGSAALLQDEAMVETSSLAYANQALTRKYRGIDVDSYVLSTSAPTWLRAVQGQIEECSRLEAGWDSYSARPISSATCAAAYRIVRELATRSTPVPSVVPTSDGLIQFEWHTNNIDLEVRVLSTTKIEVSCEDARGTLASMEDAEFSYDFRDVKKAIDVLSTR